MQVYPTYLLTYIVSYVADYYSYSHFNIISFAKARKYSQHAKGLLEYL